MVKKDTKLSLAQCENMTVKQIRASAEYKALTPLGKTNKSGSYRYGKKSTMNKAELCRALANPQNYHKQIRKLKELKQNAHTRKRSTRKGLCLVEKRKIPCRDPVYKYQGLTTLGNPCCYKKPMSVKTLEKRRKQDFTNMTVKQLKQLCKKNKIKGYSKLRKSELIKKCKKLS